MDRTAASVIKTSSEFAFQEMQNAPWFVGYKTLANEQFIRNLVRHDRRDGQGTLPNRAIFR
jgi:hypothetical protein